MSKYGVLSGSYFPAFGLNTERYRVSLRTQSKYWKIRTWKNSVFGRFSRSEIISYNDVVVGSLPFYSYSIFLVFFDTVYIRLALCQIMGEVVGETILNILKITRAMLMSFASLIVRSVRFLFGLQNILLVSADFCLWIEYFKKWTALRTETAPHLQPLSSSLPFIHV